MEDVAERVASADGSETQQPVRSPRRYVLGDREARASQRQQRSWRQTHPGMVEVPTVAPRPCEGLALPVAEDMGLNDQPEADPIYPLTPLPRRWRFDL
jgi:hypothetical protein